MGLAKSSPKHDRLVQKDWVGGGGGGWETNGVFILGICCIVVSLH